MEPVVGSFTSVPSCDQTQLPESEVEGDFAQVSPYKLVGLVIRSFTSVPLCASTQLLDSEIEGDFAQVPPCVREPYKQKAGDSTIEDLEEVMLFDDKPDRKVYVGAELDPEVKAKIISFLKDNSDCFAWSHADMVGIDPKIAMHKLNVDPKYRPVKQKKRPNGGFRRKVINDEVERLLTNGFIKEVKYPEWLANTVVVPKKNGKWRVCVDYTDLNKACPKDSFPLPHIDRLIDSTT